MSGSTPSASGVPFSVGVNDAASTSFSLGAIAWPGLVSSVAIVSVVRLWMYEWLATH